VDTALLFTKCSYPLHCFAVLGVRRQNCGILVGLFGWTTMLQDGCLLLFLLCSTGCVASKRAYLVIPVCCSRVNSESFTRPCASRTGGELVCDGVVVTPNCVALRPGGR